MPTCKREQITAGQAEPREVTMIEIIEVLRQEHRNIEKLLRILERELNVFDRGDRPDYEVVRAVISYFEVYPEVYHHPQEDLGFAKLRTRDRIVLRPASNVLAKSACLDNLGRTAAPRVFSHRALQIVGAASTPVS